MDATGLQKIWPLECNCFHQTRKVSETKKKVRRSVREKEGRDSPKRVRGGRSIGKSKRSKEVTCPFLYPTRKAQ